MTGLLEPSSSPPLADAVRHLLFRKLRGELTAERRLSFRYAAVVVRFFHPQTHHLRGFLFDRHSGKQIFYPFGDRKPRIGGALAVAAIAYVGVAQAQENATITLRSGERISGQLVDLNASGFTVKVNNEDRQVPKNDVAVIDFTGFIRL